MDLLEKVKKVLPITYTDEYKEANISRCAQWIPVHKISANPHQPRRHFGEESIKELADSIKRYGVIQPITVRALGQNSYELVAGERRLRASVMCGMRKIPAMVVSYSDSDSAIVALVENIQRENLSFMEEASSYKSIIYTHGFTQEELARKIGKTQSFVANKIRLLKLSPIVRETIKEASLSERHARALLRLPGEEEQLCALEKIADRGLNVAQTEALIEEMLTEKEKEKAKKKETPSCVNTKDVRIFVNTIRHAIDVMKKNGIDTQCEEKESDSYIEYTILIPKKESE